MTARRLRDQRGFTVIELMVSMTLAMMLFGATLTVYDSIQDEHKRVVEHNDAQDRARLTVERMARELRNLASPSDFNTQTGTYPNSVEKNDRYDFIFKSVDDANGASPLNPTAVQRVRYCLDDNKTLWRQAQNATTFTVVPPASAMCPELLGWTSTQKVAADVTNRADGRDRALFHYTAEGRTLGYNDPEAITDTTRVEARLFLDPTPGRNPAEVRLSSSVLLRNQNQRPTAVMSEPKVTVRTVYLNGSASDDPEGEVLKFAWYDLSVSESEPFSTVVAPVISYSEPGIHVYKLVVTDPSGLEDTAGPVTVEVL